MIPTIQRAVQQDFSAVCALLRKSGLPYDDLTAPAMEHFWIAKAGGMIFGVIGLEPYGRDGLLRSLAVEKDRQGQGWGSRLVAHLENAAKGDGVQKLYLLTTTAQDFFAARQYKHIERKDAPEAIQASREFASLCPDSAVCMVKKLV